MVSNKVELLVNLRCVAALAAKMANDAEQNKLWPGDLDKATAQMKQWLEEVKE